MRKSTFLARHGPAYLMLLVPLTFFALFSVYPLLWAAKYVFYYYNGIDPERFSGWTNFERLAGDDLYWQSLWKQGIFALKVVIELPLAFLLALLLHSRIKGGNILRAIFVIPYILPGSTMALILYILLNPYNGEINKILMWIGLIDKPMEFLAVGWTAMLSGMLLDAWQNFGINMLFFLVGLSSIPKEVFESAAIDGASRWQTVRLISIPMMGRILQVILFLSILHTLKSVGPYLVLTNGGPNYATENTFLYIFHQFFGGASSTNFGYGATTAVVTALLLVLLSFGYFRLTKRMDYH